MDEYGLVDVCDLLGLRSGPAYGGGDKWGPHMSISCPLAPIRHNDQYDWNTSCSVSLSDDEPSLVRCFSFNCQYKGSLYNMLKLRTEHDGNPDDLVALLKKIEPTEKFTLESSLARSKKRYDEQIERLRKPILPKHDKDVLAESRMEKYAGGVPHYAITRGLTVDSCKAWGLGHDKQNARLVFPVRRHDGKLVGLTGRLIPAAQKRLTEQLGRNVPKYHNYVGLDKSKYIFGEHMLEEGKPVVICEGQIDAILTWQALGIPAVAPLGEGFSERHVRTIAAFSPPVVYIFPDNDPPGRLAAEKFEYALHGRMPLKLMMPPEGKDPGGMTAEQITEARDCAKPILGKIRWE